MTAPPGVPLLSCGHFPQWGNQPFTQGSLLHIFAFLRSGLFYIPFLFVNFFFPWKNLYNSFHNAVAVGFCNGNFTYFLRVINDLDYKDVLQRTGSKTLFVADDNAFKKGIKEKWGFDEYSQLTAAHKRMILYGAMLDKGATTFWEDFDLAWVEGSGRIDEFPQNGEKDIHGDYGAYCYVGFRHSLCHGWSAGVIAFMKEENL